MLPRFGGANQQAVTTIGLDIAKSVFQVHGIDAEGKVLIRRQLKRRYVLAFFEKQQPCPFIDSIDPKRTLWLQARESFATFASDGEN
ncbi:MAG TPA: hypothetical protein VLE24_07040 [Methyloceanibacter sp.]|nr:hypothetical protein [Methyloceanibacter sp.]